MKNPTINPSITNSVLLLALRKNQQSLLKRQQPLQLAAQPPNQKRSLIQQRQRQNPTRVLFNLFLVLLVWQFRSTQSSTWIPSQMIKFASKTRNALLTPLTLLNVFDEEAKIEVNVVIESKDSSVSLSNQAVCFYLLLIVWTLVICRTLQNKFDFVWIKYFNRVWQFEIQINISFKFFGSDCE